jgi:hypothetical protein
VVLMTGRVFGGSVVDTAIAEAPMKAQRRLGLDLSWPRITSAFLTDVAVLVLASHLPGARQTVAWWYGVAVAAVDHEQLAVRVDPTGVGAAPKYSVRTAEGSDDARRAVAVASAR